MLAAPTLPNGGLWPEDRALLSRAFDITPPFAPSEQGKSSTPVVAPGWRPRWPEPSCLWAYGGAVPTELKGHRAPRRRPPIFGRAGRPPARAGGREAGGGGGCCVCLGFRTKGTKKSGHLCAHLCCPFRSQAGIPSPTRCPDPEHSGRASGRLQGSCCPPRGQSGLRTLSLGSLFFLNCCPPPKPPNQKLEKLTGSGTVSFSSGGWGGRGQWWPPSLRNGAGGPWGAGLDYVCVTAAQAARPRVTAGVSERQARDSASSSGA